ncbi:MAG TPA: DUF5671 domain-containing protein [Patescibacteria group bacterium]|nr:DUF5671 domain-containing protein [Patescibacteria group bacterium]
MSEKDYKGKGALDAFLNLLSLITLGWVSISIGGVLFQIIDKFFNPALSGSLTQFSQSSLKASVAATIIVTPIFLAVAGYLHKHYKKDKLNHNSGIYRWLTYLMLLIAAINIIGSLIMIIYRLLDGVYTMSSILKILVVLVIAVAIFGYYWYDLKRKDYSKRSPVSIVAFSAIIVVAVFVVITSFFIVDSPRTARMKKFDAQRVNDLSTINSLIMSSYMQNSELPSDISDVRFSAIIDPETKQPYGYNVLGEKNYELCANFSLSADNMDKSDPYIREMMISEGWFYHLAGPQCFQTKINEQLLNDLQKQIQAQIPQSGL